MKKKIMLFIVDFIAMYLKVAKDEGKTYKEKPITAVHSQMIGLTGAVNQVFKTALTGQEVYNDYVKPLVEDKKLYTIPAKKGYMISLTPFARTNKVSEDTTHVLELLAKQYSK